MGLDVRKCLYCSKDYQPTSPRQMYCSRDCRREFRSEVVECKFCGKKFKTLKEKRRMFCSQECYGRAKRVRVFIKTCPICGRKFRTKKTKKGVYYKITCSLSCSQRLRHQKIGGPSKSRRSFGRSTKIYRAIVEEKLGRKLGAGTVVHHLDLNHENNNPENLWVYPDSYAHQSTHSKLTHLALRKLVKLGYVPIYDNGIPVGFQKRKGA